MVAAAREGTHGVTCCILSRTCRRGLDGLIATDLWWKKVGEANFASEESCSGSRDWAALAPDSACWRPVMRPLDWALCLKREWNCVHLCFLFVIRVLVFLQEIFYLCVKYSCLRAMGIRDYWMGWVLISFFLSTGAFHDLIHGHDHQEDSMNSSYFLWPWEMIPAQYWW